MCDGFGLNTHTPFFSSLWADFFLNRRHWLNIAFDQPSDVGAQKIQTTVLAFHFKCFDAAFVRKTRYSFPPLYNSMCIQKFMRSATGGNERGKCDKEMKRKYETIKMKYIIRKKHVKMLAIKQRWTVLNNTLAHQKSPTSTKQYFVVFHSIDVFVYVDMDAEFESLHYNLFSSRYFFYIIYLWFSRFFSGCLLLMRSLALFSCFGFFVLSIESRMELHMFCLSYLLRSFFL